MTRHQHRDPKPSAICKRKQGDAAKVESETETDSEQSGKKKRKRPNLDSKESSSEPSSQSSDEEVNERLIENKPGTGRGESKTTTDSKQTKVSVDDQSETESDSDSESGIETKQKQSKTNSSSNCDDPQSSMESSSEEEDEIVNEHINKGKDGKGKSETSHSKQTNDSDDDLSETESDSESGMDDKQKQSTINLSSNCNDPQSSSESSSDEEGQKDEHVNKIKVRREDSEKESEESQSETESDEDQMEKVSEKSQFEKVTSDEESVELAPKSGSRNISSISQNSNNFESFVTEKKQKKGRKEIELSTSKKHQQTVATREKDQLYLSSWRQAKGKSDTKIQCYSASARKLVTENVKVVKIVAIGGDEIKDFRNTDLDQMPMTSAVWASHNQFQTSEFIINLDREYKGGVLLSMDEARENIDFLIRKGESLGGHPFHLSTTVKTAFTFAFQDTVQAALKEKGFMFRNGNFTTREDKLISENFELFLSKHHICSKSEKVQEILFSNISTEFQRQTGILVFVAHRLPRSSYQIYYRLRHLYHKGNYKGAFTASESQRVLELVKSGKTIETGHNGQYKEVGDEIGRYRNSVRTKYNSIKKAKGDILDIGQKDFGTLVRVIQKITDEMDLSTVKEIAWNDVAKELKKCQSDQLMGRTPVELARFWARGTRRFMIYQKGTWTMKDSLKLVNLLDAQRVKGDLVDEFDIEWDQILEQFSNVVDVQHLRNKWLALRLAAPFYMLKCFGEVLEYLKDVWIPGRLKKKQELNEDDEDDAILLKMMDC